MENMNSVHLQAFPQLKQVAVDTSIVEKMDAVRDICNCVFSLRKEANIRVRMPLSKIIVCSKTINLDEEYIELLKQEVNVKNVEFYSDDLEKIATMEIKLDMKECGKMFGSKLKDILQAQKQGKWQIKDGVLHIADCEIEKEFYNVVYTPKNGTKAIQCSNSNTLVMIDTNITEELQIEGISRDLIRIIQQTRKDNGLEISDRIDVEVGTKNDIFDKVMDTWKDFIMSQTLADNIVVVDKMFDNSVEIDGIEFSVKISKK